MDAKPPAEHQIDADTNLAAAAPQQVSVAWQVGPTR
ncbi:hypothetical protein MMUC44124_17990 [Mycolicibacterium mucogenicum DSM 44124]|nr:hypothetical protein MMUC44124_17990 [Mycolicibacterium mucogenicum DSM 44124]